MSKKVTYLMGILLSIIIGTILYWFFCCNCACKQPATPISQEDAAISGGFSKFSLNGKDLNYQCYDNFRFSKDGFNHLEPVGDSINKGIDLLKASFAKNPNQRLLITGYCTKDEKNTSAFPNLGVARANDIKNYLVARGIPAAQLDIAGEVRDTWSMQGDTILAPVDLRISEIAPETPATNSEDMNALKAKINADPLILYFNTNQSEISLSAAEREKVANIVKYLDKVSSAKISAVGHTDNVGNRDKNIQLGQNRAEFAKRYLIKNGIASDKIITNSKGPDEPMADNSTPQGKAKNRRTVISIQ